MIKSMLAFAVIFVSLQTFAGTKISENISSDLNQWFCTAEGYDNTQGAEGPLEIIREAGSSQDDAGYKAQRTCFQLGYSECTVTGCFPINSNK